MGGVGCGGFIGCVGRLVGMEGKLFGCLVCAGNRIGRWASGCVGGFGFPAGGGCGSAGGAKSPSSSGIVGVSSCLLNKDEPLA